MLTRTKISSTKRKLTEEEIESICKVIPLNKAIPEETAECVQSGLVKNLREQLVDVVIYPEGIPTLKKTIADEYYRSLLQAGEMVGVQAATSIGEPVSQMTLNAFHYSGISSIGIASGVPRVEEILNASKKQKSCVMNLFMKNKEMDIREIRKEVYHSVTEVYLGSIIDSISVDFVTRFEELEESEQKWYQLYMDMYSNEIMDEHQFLINWRIRFHLNRDKLFYHSVTSLEVASKIEHSFRDLYAVASPNNIGIVDVFVDFNCIKIKIKKKEEESMASMEDVKEIKCLHNVVIPYLKDIMVCGIEGVSDVYLHKEQNEWVIDTNGTNLSAAFANDKMDYTKCTSSDIWEIYRILGVEATRTFIIQEFYKVLATSGASVGRRHIELLADSMTYQGKVNSVNRYGIDRDQIGPMAKASFEESVRNFFIAAVNGETDRMGVSSSIMGGKLVKAGTGFVELKLDTEMVQTAKPITNFEYPKRVVESKAPEPVVTKLVPRSEPKPEPKTVSVPMYAPPSSVMPSFITQQPVYKIKMVDPSVEIPGLRSAPVSESYRPKEEAPSVKQSFMKKKKVEKKTEVLLDFEVDE